MLEIFFGLKLALSTEIIFTKYAHESQKFIDFTQIEDRTVIQFNYTGTLAVHGPIGSVMMMDWN